jgi:hypothetical protein
VVTGKLQNLLRICLWLSALGSTQPIQAASYQSVSAQYGALAPNAGGQEAYALKYQRDEWEYSLFSNQYLLAGDYPLTGFVMDYVFPVCTKDCWINFYVNTGFGGSTGGPILEATWGTQIPLLPLWLPYKAPKYVPALRIDFTTQMIFVQWRGVTWSYPVWAGITIPF